MNDTLNCLVPGSLELTPTGKGALDGKIFVVKDCIAIAGHTSSFGHPAWRATHDKSEQTAPIVTDLLGAGAHMTGLTKLDQLTFSVIGNVGEGEAPLNSLYPDRFTGGSSSGSASAVAGGLADFGVGTDTGGSIRLPAAACGIFGIRPTHGRIDATGVLPLASTFDVPGLFARDPAILLGAFKVIAQESEADFTPIQRILLATDALELTTPEIAEAVRKAAEQLAKTDNLKLEEVELGPLIEPRVADLMVRLQFREIWQQHGNWVREHMQELAPDVQARLRLCEEQSKAPEPEKQADLAAREAYRQQFNAFVRPGMVVLMPVAPELQPQRDASEEELTAFRKGSVRLTCLAGLAGAPEAAIPIKNEQNGLTYGVGLLGARNQDEVLLGLATKVEIQGE